MDLRTVEKILRNLGVSTTMVKRGYDLYKGNTVKKFELNYDENHEILEINSEVKGTKLYSEYLVLDFEGDEVVINSDHCDCPYTGWDICKHSSAVLFKFFFEYYEKFQKDMEQFNHNKKDIADFNNFRTVINNLGFVSQRVKLSYRIKGLDKSGMVNFKIFFGIEGIIEEEKLVFFDNILKIVDYRFKDYLTFLSEEDYIFIKNIRSLDFKKNDKDMSVMIPKDRESLLLIKDLIKQKKLFTEKNESLTYGGLIKPQILIDGTEKMVEIKLLDKIENLFTVSDCSWIYEDNTLYDYEDSISKINQNIKIPREFQGEFLFNQLKKLKKEYNAELGTYFENLKLNSIEPKIKVSLDYRNEAIYFDLEVNLNGKSYRNLEVDTEELYNQHDSYSKISDSYWERVSLLPVYEMFNIFNKFKYYFDKKSFYIMDKIVIQKFITEGLPHFPEEWELEKTDRFEEIKVEEIELSPIVEFVENENNINWFEFTVKYSIDGKIYTKKELDKLIEYNENGEAFIKIGNKYFLLKETEAENKVKNIIKSADVEKNGNFKSSYYNMIYYRNMLTNSGINFKGNKIYDELDRDISNMSIIEDVEMPVEVENILRPYQKEGYKWINFLNKFSFGGILADDMGLGKTLQTLSFLKHIKKDRPSLIVVPKSLIYNWKNEAEKFFPELKVFVYDGTIEWRKSKLEALKDYELVIASFDVASRDCEELSKVKFLYLVLDEAHNIKNRQTKRTTNIKKISSQYRLALTGTPLENSLEELWSIFDFVIPGYLGTFKKFNENYVKIEEHREHKMFELKNRIAPFMLRRKKEDVLKELPDKIENIVTVEMNAEQTVAYKIILDKVKEDLQSLVATKGYNNSQIGILAALTKLRQICNHPNLVFEDKEKIYESSKLETLIELVKESIYSGHKILVFSQFVQMLKLIKEKLNEEEISFEYLDGSTKNRMEIVNSFNENEDKKVFLLSLKAGGTGLNLTSADIVIHVDPWWNPQIERQATDRAHRMGQNKKVMVYKLITKGTVEEKMLKLQERKKEVFDAVIESNSGAVSKVTWTDIQDLLSLE